MNPVRLAVVGAGTIGARHIEEIVANRDAALGAIVDVSAAAGAMARDANVPLYASLDALLASERPDGILIATPNALHAPQALQCIAAGIPTFVEKPIAHTIADAVSIRDAAERANVPVLVGHHRLHSPIVQTAVDVVASGALGRIVGVIGSAVFYKPDTYFDEAWRRAPGGGPILINMIHEVASLRRIVGEIAAVQAFASNATRRFAVEDTVSIALRFANGALGTFLLSDTGASPKSWEQTSQENTAYAAYPDEDCYTVIGTDGSLGVPTMRVRRYANRNERSWFRPFAATDAIPFERRDPLALQIAHFVAVIRGEAAPLVSARDGLQNLRVVEAIAEAARSGRAVDVAA